MQLLQSALGLLHMPQKDCREGFIQDGNSCVSFLVRHDSYASSRHLKTHFHGFELPSGPQDAPADRKTTKAQFLQTFQDFGL